MSVISEIEAKYKKPQVVDVRSGDTVRVHQKIREGNKERVQVFEGLVIRTSKKNSLANTITVRRIASGVGVEKTYLVHSPLITKIQVVKRSKVRRNYLSYMRERTGKSARLSGVDFDQEAVNAIPEVEKVKEKPEEPKAETEKTESKEDNKEDTKAEQPKEEQGTENKAEQAEETKADQPKSEEKVDKLAKEKSDDSDDSKK